MEDPVVAPISQPGGAKIHTARDTMAWLTGNNIEVMEWPPNSPDLNRIEHCWKRLKENLDRRFSNLHKTKGGPESVRRSLAEALDVVWNQGIEEDFLERLWDSMPRKVAAVVDAKRWYTKY